MMSSQTVNINGKLAGIFNINDSWIFCHEGERTELIKTNKLFKDISEHVYFGKIGKSFYWFTEQFKPFCITDKSVFL